MRCPIGQVCPSASASGTSADGIDVAVCEIEREAASGRVRLVERAYECVAFPDDLRARIFAAFHPAPALATPPLPAPNACQTLCRLNFELGAAFGAAVVAVLARHSIAAGEIALVGSHGQTV